MTTTTQPREHRLIVHTLWQGDTDVGVPSSRLRITGPDPVYLYRQHGHTLVSREPMIPVEFWCNAGREEGIASQRDLIRIIVPYLTRGLNPPLQRWGDP